MSSNVNRVPCVLACTMHAVVSPAFSLTRLLLHWLAFNASNRACHRRCNNHALQLRHLDSVAYPSIVLPRTCRQVGTTKGALSTPMCGRPSVPIKLPYPNLFLFAPSSLPDLSFSSISATAWLAANTARSGAMVSGMRGKNLPGRCA